MIQHIFTGRLSETPFKESSCPGGSILHKREERAVHLKRINYKAQRKPRAVLVFSNSELLVS